MPFRYPILPFISSLIRLFISTAYSMGSSLDTLSAKPLTMSALASSSLMLPIFASWPMEAYRVRTSMAGMVSDLEMESSIRDWQDTADLVPLALGFTTTLLRNVLIPPPLLMDRVFI